MKRKRTRVDSAQSKTKAKQAAAKPLPMPEGIELNEKQLVQYRSICAEFARVELTSHKCVLVAKLAKKVVQHEEHDELLEREGPVSQGAQGGDILNPRVTFVNQLAAQIIQLRRSLGIHGTPGVRKVDVQNKRNHNKKNEQQPEEGSLIKRPSSPPDLKAVA